VGLRFDGGSVVVALEDRDPSGHPGRWAPSRGGRFGLASEPPPRAHRGARAPLGGVRAEHQPQGTVDQSMPLIPSSFRAASRSSRPGGPSGMAICGKRLLTRMNVGAVYSHPGEGTYFLRPGDATAGGLGGHGGGGHGGGGHGGHG